MTLEQEAFPIGCREHVTMGLVLFLTVTAKRASERPYAVAGAFKSVDPTLEQVTVFDFHPKHYCSRERVPARLPLEWPRRETRHVK